MFPVSYFLTPVQDGKILSMKRYRSNRRKKANSRWFVLSLGLGFLLASLIIGLKAWSDFKAIPVVIPSATRLSGISLGGLSREEALQRINEAYSVPIELRYNQARMQFAPVELGFLIDPAATLAQVDELENNQDFWNSLWGKEVEDVARELTPVYSLDENKLNLFLEQLFSLR
jgi:hypothetical protein